MVPSVTMSDVDAGTGGELPSGMTERGLALNAHSGYPRLVAQIHADTFNDGSAPGRRVTAVTRRDIFDYIRTESGPWWGRLDEVEFLGRVYDLEALSSTDLRFKTASGDIRQHRFNNLDWDDTWVFSDSRFQLMSGPDEVLLGFLARAPGRPTGRRTR
jgi:hypothetical protein